MSSRGSWLANANETVTALVADMAADPWGRFSPSVYETGRLVALTPSLPRHPERVRFLLREQHGDGRWGGPGDYDIVPTLSATHALLTEAHRPGAHPEVARAADRGVRALADRLRPNTVLPDTVAVELMVPGLVAEVNAHLTRRGDAPLPLPEGTRPQLLEQLRAAVAQGHALPEKLLHSLEIIGPVARGADSVELVRGAIVGCSPSATATWLGDEAAGAGAHPGVRYLRAVQDAGGGVPVAAPLALFERSWVLSTLVSAGLDVRVPRELVDDLHAAFSPEGAAGGAGLPPDVDDTATALYALALLGSPRSPECLWHYEADDHFRCFPEERTPSTSANAHALQAIGASLTPDLPGRERYVAAARTLTRWLSEQQNTDGSWHDKWHASPFYATACCATALAEYGGADGSKAVRRAVDWLLATQRKDGSWGRWRGTREETAYAVRTLLHQGVPTTEATARAAARGAAHLLTTDGDTAHLPLWHDKDLYTPLRIVEVEIIAALHLAHTVPAVAAQLAEDRVGV
ncbi:prenyltransferase/squalene oxidase repeat-containing protein [Prauserella flavalba]|uniref:prenyltransferase/squalene oxidase repeat-containing protein n=1 Tax=Prauserella flavalba TaxID=1477506 RepID=UPI0036EBCDAA